MSNSTDKERGLIKSPQDFVGGMALLALTIVAYIGMSNLSGMRGFSFGAGTVPRLFCGILGVLSIILVFLSFTKHGPKLEKFPWRGPLFVIAAVAFFGLTIRTLGLGITGVITVLLAGSAVEDFELKEGIIFALAMTAFCALLFPFALGQPIPLYPTFLR
ncbi:MAG: tripartite tricarboxylate transporter TctB family protein [Beijerinckiaceae bacterium]